MDIEHVKWMMSAAFEVCEKEGIDETLLLPTIILHDTGYALVERSNPFNLDIRKAHMKEGAEIAKEILAQVNYPLEKAAKIEFYVSVHDDWAFGDSKIYINDSILGVFNDLDFMWMATPLGFQNVRAYLKKNRDDMLNYIEQNSKLRTVRFVRKLQRECLKVTSNKGGLSCDAERQDRIRDHEGGVARSPVVSRRQ